MVMAVRNGHTLMAGRNRDVLMTVRNEDMMMMVVVSCWFSLPGAANGNYL
jgi:hypothetical protein